MKMHKTAVLAALLLAFGAHAQTVVKDAWVRATVASQKTSGLYAQITSPGGGKLVAASSPLAGVAEIHEMAMDGNVMRMRALSAIDLPPGKTVELKPGGYHVMLLELKQELKAGDAVPVTLVVEGSDGKRESIEAKAAVRALADSPHPGHKH